VIVVLLDAETAERDWVDHEIRRSWKRGNALVGLRVHQMKNHEGKTDMAGPNPLDEIRLEDGTPLSAVSKTYDWVDDDGRNNLGKWVEEAFQARQAYAGEEELRKATTSGASTRPRIAEPESAISSTAVRKSAPSGAFAPRAPWCANDDDRSR